MGNVASVQKALDHLKIPNVLSNDPMVIADADFILLPGVGSFTQGMKNLNELNLVDVLTEEVLVKKKPFMGVCLGMQLLATTGSEPAECKGLNFIDGEVVRIEEEEKRIPHLGWNAITIKNQDPFLAEFSEKDFYFIHSYHFHVKDDSNVAATVNYGKNDYVAAIHKDNIFATQFHPEKSQAVGLAMLKKFFDRYAKG